MPVRADATPSPKAEESADVEEVGDSLSVLEMQILQSMLLMLVVLWLARDCLFPAEL